MAVTFTANIALAKPTDSELALNWARTQKLAEDNNIIVDNLTDIELINYTPVFNATTTPPSVGAGSMAGKYQESQGYIFGTFVCIFATSGLVVGSGEYGISLPVLADSSFHVAATTFNGGSGDASCVGEGYIRDDSTINNSGTVALDLVNTGGVSYVRLVTEVFAGKTSRFVRDAMPFTVANNDSFSGMFVYKKN